MSGCRVRREGGRKGEKITVSVSHRYQLGAIQLMFALGDRKGAIKTILALGDMKLLTRPQVWGTCNLM